MKICNNDSYNGYTIIVYHFPKVATTRCGMGSVSLKERAYKHLRQRLTEGEICPGGKISLAGIAKEMGVSHIPVREAINQLCSEGYVVHTPSVGFFVRKVTRKELADLFKVREALEVLAAGEAVEKMTDEIIRQLEEIFQAERVRFRQIRDDGIEDWSGPRIKELTMLDIAFHATIVKAADNDILARVASEQRIFAKVFGQAIKGPPTGMVRRLAKVCRWHYRMLRAFQMRDAAMAEHAAAVHVREAGEYILACFDWSEQHEGKEPMVPWASDPEALLKYVGQQFLDAEDPLRRVPPPKGGIKTIGQKGRAI